jgi:hypothetical protein
MYRIAHEVFYSAIAQQQTRREKNSSRRYAIVRLRENFAVSRIHSYSVIQQGAEEKWPSAPYSLDSYPRSSY